MSVAISYFLMLTNLVLGQVQIHFSEHMCPELRERMGKVNPVFSACNLAFPVNSYSSKTQMSPLFEDLLDTLLPNRVKNALFRNPAWLFMLRDSSYLTELFF